MWKTEARRKHLTTLEDRLEPCIYWCKRWIPKLLLVALGFALGLLS